MTEPQTWCVKICCGWWLMNEYMWGREEENVMQRSLSRAAATLICVTAVWCKSACSHKPIATAITLAAGAQPYPIQAMYADAWCIPRQGSWLLSRSLCPLQWYLTTFILERWFCHPESPSSTTREVILCGRSTCVEFTAISHKIHLVDT